jgi:hypothetical protein
MRHAFRGFLLRCPARTVVAGVLVLCASAPFGAAVRAADSAGQQPARTVAAPADADDGRYAPRDPSSLVVPRKAVGRKDYVDLVRPLAAGFESGPDRGQYGPRHALPALAVYSLEGDAGLAGGIKRTLRHYGDWVAKCVRQDGGVFSLEGATLCALAFRELRKRDQMTIDDEAWARRLMLTLCEHQYAWRPKDGLWRGPHHRSQAQGSNHALAAAFYPDEREALRWHEYGDKVWSDWWDFRDVGINDTGYFYSSLGIVLRTAELLAREEVFSDDRVREFIFDRVLFELTPDGAAPPYGSHGGYNGHAGDRIFALELAARHTRDGRYRWGAERLMNFGQARGFSNNHHHLQALSMEAIALASLVCDDSVKPAAPDGGCRVLSRREIRRLNDKEARERFPDAAGVDCNMVMSQKIMPHKLVFRAGWEPGDMFMLVECFARHDPLNPTAIMALERWSSSFAEMASEKFISRENAVRIDDLSGTAAFLGRKDFKGEKRLPTGWAGMETTAEVLADHPLAAHARLHVTNYMGYSAAQTREFLFVKNRFVVVRDETLFEDAFRGRIGPVWNTQNVGRPRGPNWINTWFTGHWFQQARLYDNPPWDLLVYHSPKPGRKLEVLEPQAQGTPAEPTGGALARLYSTRYAWEGEIAPASRLQFVQVLLPHAPLRDATPLAQGIEVLADEPGVAALAVARQDRCEVAILNPDGRPLDFKTRGGGRVATDARAAYVDVGAAKSRPALAVGASFLTVDGQTLSRTPNRTTFSSGTRIP